MRVAVPPGKRLDSIQILRGCAVSLVVLQHSHIAIRSEGDLLSRFGFTGVDLFFLISGYIFSRQAARREFNLPLFMRNRFVRIYPSYWLLLPVVLLFWWMGIGNISEMSNFKLAPIIKSIALFPQRTGRLYTVAWTLEIELMFYTVFALLCSLRKQGWLIPVLYSLGLAALLAPIPLAFQQAWFSLWDYSYTLMFFVEFATGALVFRMGRRTEKLGWKTPLLCGLCLYVLSVVVFVSTKSPYATNVTRIIGMSCSLALVMVAAVNAENEGRLRSSVARIGVFLGEASYSIYLVHLLVFGLAFYVTERLGTSSVSPGGWISESWRAVSIILAVAISVAYYRTAEIPLLRFTRS
jgi:exopolysaccharide production protein ExoZ